LEAVLAHENDTGNLTGILNGCDYPEDRHVPVMEMPEMFRGFQRQIMQWSAGRQTVSSADFIAGHNLSGLLQRRNRPRPDRSRPDHSRMVLCSVTRLTEQKVLLMRQGQDGMSAMARILTALGDDGVYVLLGTGHDQFVRFFTQLEAWFPNFIFLHGFSDQAARTLYANGDLFLMPSSFEPCGIGQMLAMRDGQPCVVHAVGGLCDTVIHGVNGFCFGGSDLDDQAQNFVETASQAIELFKNDPDKWQQIKTNAAAARFLWQHAAQQYVEKLYG
jgi:starch synthase